MTRAERKNNVSQALREIRQALKNRDYLDAREIDRLRCELSQVARFATLCQCQELADPDIMQPSMNVKVAATLEPIAPGESQVGRLIPIFERKLGYRPTPDTIHWIVNTGAGVEPLA